MAIALQKTMEMRELVCGECGINFMAPEFFMAEKQANGSGWHCPNGHTRAYIESDVAKLRKQLEAEKQKSAMEASTRRMVEETLEKERREAKRLKKRTDAGVCTCCNRTFQNLARHMKTKHDPKVSANKK